MRSSTAYFAGAGTVIAAVVVGLGGGYLFFSGAVSSPSNWDWIAPAIYGFFNGTPRAFEATWKYLLVGGTGVALSLLGSFCLGYASLRGGGVGGHGAPAQRRELGCRPSTLATAAPIRHPCRRRGRHQPRRPTKTV